MKRALVVLVSVLLLTGCAAPTADSAYLSTVRESIPALADVPDEDLTGLGAKVCDLFDTGGFTDGLTEFIARAKDYGFTAKEAGGIAGAATAAYCPEYSDGFG
jgi:hypothetical protein